VFNPKFEGALRILFWLGLVFAVIMALLPKPPALPVEVGDKVQHMIAFATLAGLAGLGYSQTRLRVILLILAGVGAFIEVGQMIPSLHRDAEMIDWLADCASSLAVLALVYWARRRQRLAAGRAWRAWKQQHLKRRG
jgi:VanZ family protein